MGICVPFKFARKFPTYELFLKFITLITFPALSSPVAALEWKALVHAARNKTPF